MTSHETLLTNLRQFDVPVTDDVRLLMSASAGAATDYPPLAFDILLADADRDMYRAKARTRQPDTRAEDPDKRARPTGHSM